MSEPRRKLHSKTGVRGRKERFAFIGVWAIVRGGKITLEDANGKYPALFGASAEALKPRTWVDKCSHPLQRETSIMFVQDLLRDSHQLLSLNKGI